MYTIFLGAPGTGKGTHAAALAEQLNLVHIASGDLFRQALDQGTELGKQAKACMKKGELVPDELTTKMILERMMSPDYLGGAILDGFPRTQPQAKALGKAMAKMGKEIDKVIYIRVSEEKLQKRLSGRWICRNCQTPYHAINSPPSVVGKCDKCGGELYRRPDDTAETIKRRLQVYFTETAPLIDYYRASGKLVEVDGEGEVVTVRQKIAAIFTEELATKTG